MKIQHIRENLKALLDVQNNGLPHGQYGFSFLVSYQTWAINTYPIILTSPLHYSDVIMSAMVSRITGVQIVCTTVCSSANQRKHQSSASLVFVRGIHRWPVNSPYKGPITRKMFPFDDVIMGRDSRWRNVWNFWNIVRRINSSPLFRFQRHGT